MEKQLYYVSVTNLTCQRQPGWDCYQFAVTLEPYKARIFQKLFRQIYTLEGPNAFRAQLPYIPYGMDRVNHALDARYKKIYALIHEYGDEETKRFVEQCGLFNGSGAPILSDVDRSL